MSAATPVPVPTSSTRWPAWTLARASRSRAGSANRGAWTRSYVVATSSYERQSSMGGKGTRGGRKRRKATTGKDDGGAAADTLWRHVGSRRMTGIAGVLALVLAETFAGAATFTWISPLWTETKRSYFTLWSALAAL